MISNGCELVDATRYWFPRFLTEIAAFAGKIGKGLPEKISMILQAAMHEYCFPNDVYESIYTVLLAFLVYKIESSVIAWSTLALDVLLLLSFCIRSQNFAV